VVASIGSDAWDRLFGGPRPAGLHPFIELKGPRHQAPATPGDLLFHIRAESLDVCFELAGRILKSMAGGVTVVDEVHGFKFFDNRDLLGSSTAPKTLPAQLPSTPPLSVTKIRTSPAPATSTCKSTCTTCSRGSRCRSPIRRT